jgi:hypothetical protein
MISTSFVCLLLHTVMLLYLYLTFHGEIDTSYVSRRVSESAIKLFFVIVYFHP